MKYLVIILIYFLSQFCVFSKEDTLNTRFKTVEIIESKLIDNKFQSGLASEFISFSEKDFSLVLTDVLKKSAILNIKDYGGLGDIKTISLRGANSQQTSISIDGIPLNSSNTTSINLANFPIDLFSSAEIVKSGSSVIYGSGSMGGCINFVTKRNSEYEKIYTKLSYGSFDTKLFELGFSLNKLKIPLNFSMNYLKTNGEFNFIFNNFGEKIDTTRKNNQYNSINLIANYNIIFENSTLSIIDFFNLSEKGLPGAVLIGKLEDSKTRFSESSNTFLANYFWKIDTLNSLTIKEFCKISNSTLTNFLFQSNANFNVISYNYMQNKIITEYSSENRLFFFKIRNEINYDGLTGNISNNDSINGIYRFQTSLSSNFFKQISFGQYLISTNLGIRYDYFAHPIDYAFSYILGSEISTENSNWKIFLNHSKNYRVPNFYELYYLNYGNINLKPETSYSYNIGGHKSFLFNKISCNLFYMNILNQILSVPKNPIMWSAQNFGKVENYGFDFEIKSNIVDEILNLGVSYTRQKTIDKSKNSISYNMSLPYIPEEKFALNLDFHINDLTLNSIFNYNSFVYTLPDNSINSVIPSNYNLDLSFNYLIKFTTIEFLTQFSVKNLTNEQLQKIINYPLPGRNYLFSLKTIFK